jgi:lysozyme
MDRTQETALYIALSAAVVWIVIRKMQNAPLIPAFTLPNLIPGPIMPEPTFSQPQPAPLAVGPSTLAFLKAREGLRLSPYPDAAGYSIGYGHYLGTKPEPASITTAQAEAFLLADARAAAIAVVNGVRVPINQNQFDALVSFVYNLGASAFRNSTLLEKLNAGDFAGAANEFGRWIYVQGHVSDALTRRRALERDLFLS